ncbi:MAG: flagellar basal body L-ring protein FlgH [Armatimonadetes bacterium]|nr:flagellar basal body L-ring protein FlgH [Armatimonadota bacterium]
MKRAILLLGAVLIALSSMAHEPNQPSGSLYPPNGVSLYADAKARKKGDIITIIVSESAVATSQADTKTAKAESASADPGIGPILRALLPELGASGRTSLNASGSTTRSGSLIARITALVVEELPNGLVKIEGLRTVQINGETQKLTIGGMVRLRDVAPDNTIQSTLVANAEIKFEGKGVIGSRQQEGLITRLFKILF